MYVCMCVCVYIYIYIFFGSRIRRHRVLVSALGDHDEPSSKRAEGIGVDGKGSRKGSMMSRPIPQTG